MKEIGQKLKEARESNGVTIEEAAEDLKLRVSQIENIEEGNIKAFKDVFYLKYFIREYAKYLGLNYEKLVDEFNEFLFDYTSKIPINDIEKAKKEKKEESKKIISPYTLNKEKKMKIPAKVIYIIIGLLIIVIGYIIVSMYGTDAFNKDEANIIYKEVV
ncbi:MAG: helix-turn-helix domain-containing protein [Bacilli bacterium]